MLLNATPPIQECGIPQPSFRLRPAPSLSLRRLYITSKVRDHRAETAGRMKGSIYVRWFARGRAIKEKPKRLRNEGNKLGATQACEYMRMVSEHERVVSGVR